MIKGRDQKALDIAAAPTLEKMRRDRKVLPRKLSKLMTYLVNHLFDVKLTATLAWDKAKIKDHRLSAAFRDGTNMTLRRYIERRRLEVADRMVRLAPEVELGRISLLVGFQYHGTFVSVYKKWLRETPSEARGKAGPEAMDYLQWRRWLRGELDTDGAWDLQETHLRLYPTVEEQLRERYRQVSGDCRIEVGGPRQVQWSAEGIWQELRALPFAEQKRLLGGVRFHSTALFDLLRQKSREEGRRSRRRGVEVAELALVSLEGSEQIFGERIHDLKALGWAWLGNAHVLALDFTAAEAAFEEADGAWSLLRAEPDQLVLARICNLKGKFRMVIRRYDEALRLVDRARELFQLGLDPQGEARALMQRASILCYSRRFDSSIVALEAAATLLKRDEDPYLGFALAGNLANMWAKVGRYAAASEYLALAEDHLARSAIPLGRHELEWISGDIEHGMGVANVAEELYLAARAGFLEAQEWSCVALVSLDLAILSAERRSWHHVVEMAAGAVPILESLQLHEETVVAVSLLAEAVRVEDVKMELLRNVREFLQQDPLVRLVQEWGPEQPFPAPIRT